MDRCDVVLERAAFEQLLDALANRGTPAVRVPVPGARPAELQFALQPASRRFGVTWRFTMVWSAGLLILAAGIPPFPNLDLSSQSIVGGCVVVTSLVSVVAFDRWARNRRGLLTVGPSIRIADFSGRVVACIERQDLRLLAGTYVSYGGRGRSTIRPTLAILLPGDRSITLGANDPHLGWTVPVPGRRTPDYVLDALDWQAMVSAIGLGPWGKINEAPAYAPSSLDAAVRSLFRG